MTDEHREREDKYDVPTGFEMPDLASVIPDTQIAARTYELDATYYDTPQAHLRRRRITLRKRKGGRDAGWHLKLPNGDSRTEINVESRATTPPRELSALLQGVRESAKLTRVATVSTNRTSHVLTDSEGREVAEVADDRVRSVRLGEPEIDSKDSTADGAARLDEWREVEVEIGPAGDEDVLARIGALLREAGAVPASSPSKLARAMGPMRDVERRRRLGGLVDAYLQAQYDALLDGDLALRRGVNVVHPTRVAVRRLRSTVRIFAELFDADEAARLETELAWYGEVLGSARDADILRERLTRLQATLPADAVLGPVSAELVSVLAKDRATAGDAIARTLKGKRYLELVQLLGRWRDEPPFTEAADQPRKAVAQYVDAAERKLRKRIKDAVQPEASEEFLHRARKTAKRLRYAAELAEPTLGKPATKTVQRAKKLQTLLGEYQDIVQSISLLRRLGASAGTGAGQNGFTYGVLLAQEWQRAEETRAMFVRRYS